MPSKTEQWRSIAETELRGRPVDDLTWKTLEGIDVQPIYTADDLEGVDHLGTIPGEAPFTRGVKATMYAGRPWTIRQYAGFSTAEESNAFYRKALDAGSRACQWPSIWPPTGAMTAITNALSGMWARRASPSTASRI